MNKGIERASGEIVAILNGDDCYREGALRNVAAAFEKNPDWGALFGDIVYVDGEGQEIFRRLEAAYDYDVLRFGNVCYIIHPTLFVKKTIYDRIGAYRYEKFLNCCDLDFILRLGQAGMPCRSFADKLLANYRLHEHGQSADRRVSENMQRESLAIRKEHGFPGGASGKLLEIFAKAKRQLKSSFTAANSILCLESGFSKNTCAKRPLSLRTSASISSDLAGFSQLAAHPVLLP